MKSLLSLSDLNYPQVLNAELIICFIFLSCQFVVIPVQHHGLNYTLLQHPVFSPILLPYILYFWKFLKIFPSRLWIKRNMYTKCMCINFLYVYAIRVPLSTSSLYKQENIIDPKYFQRWREICGWSLYIDVLKKLPRWFLCAARIWFTVTYILWYVSTVLKHFGLRTALNS